MGKKLKLKESLEKNVGKIGEKKVEKKVKKILCWYKISYMSVKKVPPGERLKKSCERSLKKFQKGELQKFQLLHGQKLKICWKNR